MITDGRHQQARHRRGPGTDPGQDRQRVGWRRVVAALVSLAVAGYTAFALSSPAGAAVTLAEARLVNAAGNEVGKVVFKGQGTYVVRAEVQLNVPPDAPGLGSYHGLHIHSVASCVPPFTSAGGHWNPTNMTHGSHAGDLPSVLISERTRASYVEFETDRFDVASLLDNAGDGSAVVLHAGPDNFANVPTAVYGLPSPATLATGDAGGRYACGVVTAVQ